MKEEDTPAGGEGPTSEDETLEDFWREFGWGCGYPFEWGDVTTGGNVVVGWLQGVTVVV